MAIAGPNAIIDTIHSIGLPYCATIPVAAILVRSTFVYYLASKPARRQAQIAAHLVPLVSARTRMLVASRAERMKVAKYSKSEVARTGIARLRTGLHAFRSMRMYRKVFGTNMPWGLVNFGVLIAFSEAIRMKCGRSDGLLSLILTPMEKIWKWLNTPLNQLGTQNNGLSQPVDPVEALAARLQAAMDAMMPRAKPDEQPDPSDSPITPDAFISGHYRDVNLNSVTPMDTPNPYFDAAVQSEGFSFCPDLTLADPTNTLPCLAAIVLIGSVIFRPAAYTPPPVSKAWKPTAPKSAEDGSQSVEPPSATLSLAAMYKWRHNQSVPFMQKVSLVFACLFSAVAFNLPAAILLYIIPSVATGWLQNRYMDIEYPNRPPIRACKRPLRLRDNQSAID